MNDTTKKKKIEDQDPVAEFEAIELSPEELATTRGGCGGGGRGRRGGGGGGMGGDGGGGE